MKSSKLKSLKDEVFKIEVFKIKVEEKEVTVEKFYGFLKFKFKSDRVIRSEKLRLLFEWILACETVIEQLRQLCLTGTIIDRLI